MKTRASKPDRHIGARAHRGLATVEFAICAPLLCFLLLATGEIGRLLFQYNTLTKAVRDGARYAAARSSSNGTRIVSISPQLATETRNLVVTGNIAGTGRPVLAGLAPTNVTVEAVRTAAGTSTGFIRVVVTNYSFTPIIGNALPSFGFGNSISLNMPLPATVVMRALL